MKEREYETKKEIEELGKSSSAIITRSNDCRSTVFYCNKFETVGKRSEYSNPMS